jgi:molybdopterin-binding protein
VTAARPRLRDETYPHSIEMRYYRASLHRKRTISVEDGGPGSYCRHCQRAAAHGSMLQETIMRISARNQIKGTVVEVKKGATTSHVRVDIGNGQIVTSSITNEAVDDLGIKAKSAVIVVVKASDVMIAVD